MRSVANGTDGIMPKGQNRVSSKKPAASLQSADLIPLYDREQFLFLVERERARADRAAARPPKASRQKSAQSTPESNGSAAAAHPPSKAPARGQPKQSSEGVWGATTDNREFSLVIFRPRARADRGGLVELLQCCVRTTDAVGIIDARRLGVLLPDTAAGNALLFVKKVLSLAEEQDVHLSHVVHTYPAAWPDEDSPLWHEPRHLKEEESTQVPAKIQPPARTQRKATDRGLVRGLVNWLQAAAFRRPARPAVRAAA